MLTPQWIDDLLALPTVPAQRQRMQQAGLADEAGLAALLDAGSQRLTSDLAQARQLLDLCSALAPDLAPALEPQAIYLRAQALAMGGDLEAALAGIVRAQEGFQATGQTAAALRTIVGQLNVLIHLGRYQPALDAAEAGLAAVAHADSLPSETGALLSALIRQNQGNCFKYMGRYAEALAAFDAAEGGFQTLPGHEDDAATLGMNRGVILAELGRGSEALAAYQAAAAIFAQTGNHLRQAQTLENLGELHLWLGNYAQSLAAFDAARPWFQTLDAALELHILQRLTADAYLALNLLPEADAAYRDAIAGLAASGVAYDLGWAQWGLGATLLRRGQLVEAGQALEAAATIFAAAGNQHLRSAVLLEQAALAAAQGHSQAAMLRVQEALALTAEQDWPVQRVYACLRMADLLLPDSAAAEPFLAEAQRLAETLPLPPLRIGVQQRLGRLYRMQGRGDEAEATLSAALAEIERLRGGLARQALRVSFLHDKTAVYQELVQLYLARGDQASLEQAFAVAEQAKSRALVELLSGVVAAATPAAGDPALARRLQALQADLNVVYNEALGDAVEGDRSVRLAELNQRATRLEQEIGRVQWQASRGAAGDLAPPAVAPPAVAPRALAPDQTLLAYHILDDEVLAFVWREGYLHVARGLARAPEIARLLAALDIEWQRFQADTPFVQRHLPRLIQSVQQVLDALHRALIAPLAELLAGSARLAIVPHGLLHHLPFAALFDGQSYLVEQFELTVAPSATVLALCSQRGARPLASAAIFGVADPLIPLVRQETMAIRRCLPAASLYLDEQATLASLADHAAGSDLLHLACHGLFRQDNPLFSALKLHDGWLTAGDVLRLALDGPLVTLSACESGRSQVLGGDELLGLPYAFLGAGAAALLVSLWLVDDESTATLMAAFYRRVAQGDGYAAALRHAQRSLLASHPHPYYWAPFTLVGGQPFPTAAAPSR